jgi:hypothetical protein
VAISVTFLSYFLPGLRERELLAETERRAFEVEIAYMEDYA